ncbi:hypothetical protein HER10_EVM0000301 [Colletotrichum scovillei]|uniref:uncharacterized protein n=1 Tax=Colletotrichum scovillei TaxID=1209932 RepID=UPI0015C2E074|nr:uncharacterized protein HER10_EVM0000301 [Colletotrichum scovillei]KAF4774496.1 hypothetical protein HER10_EVM0000301 [Colletotrichum scovillei]
MKDGILVVRLGMLSGAKGIAQVLNLLEIMAKTMPKPWNLPSGGSATHPEVQKQVVQHPARHVVVFWRLAWLCRTADSMSWECVRMLCQPVRWLATSFTGHTPPFRRHNYLIPIRWEPRP